MKLAMVADKSTSAVTQVEGECPGMGGSWINLNPAADAAAILSDVTTVRAANLKFVAGLEGAWKKPQWCYQAVSATGGKTTCNFDTASNANYTAALYCETIEGWFFASTKVSVVTAKDNGGKPVTLSLTYKKAIDVVADNTLVLSICKALAENLAVPYDRVTDAYGGYYGNPSPSLPAASTAAKTTNTTTNTTRML